MNTLPPAIQAEASALRAALAEDKNRRSIGRVDEVVRNVCLKPVLFGTLFGLMFDEDAVVRMRASDTVEKITRDAPELLRPWKKKFLARLPEIEQAEVCWHAALLVPRFALTAAERRNVAVPVLRAFLRDGSRIVQTFALQALADLAQDDPALRREVVALAEDGLHTGSPAFKVRCRRILANWTPPPTPFP